MDCPFCNSELLDHAVFCSRCGKQIPGHEESPDVEYAAFISYRHLPRDAEAAKQVQKAIETYRLPRGASHSLCQETRARRLGKCFRDEDELAASHSLPESIKTALAKSHTLVLICTPETQESKWVQREVETFVALHGRERVICVLAGGDSASSIPDLLKTRMIADANGTMRNMPAEPLAADLRPESASKHKAEMLRIIAAVAGLGYDDLRRREQARKRRRIGIGAIAAVAIVAVVAAAIMQFQSIRQTALAEESKSLAAQALAQYEQGEHLQAIETALSALPSSEADTSRPLVPEAKAALEKVLALNPDPKQPWIPLYSADADSPIVSCAYSQEVEWACILDESGMLSVFDMFSSKPYSTVAPSALTLRENTNPQQDWFISAIGPESLVAGNRTGTGALCAINPKTGEEIWSLPGEYALAALPIPGKNAVCLFTYSSTALTCKLADIGTGEVIAQQVLSFSELPRYISDDAFCIAPSGKAAYAALGNAIYCFGLENGESRAIGVDGPMLLSAKCTDTVLITTAADFLDDGSGSLDTNNVPYQITARNLLPPDLSALWAHSGTYGFTVSGSAEEPYPVNSFPRTWFVADASQPAVIVSAGKGLLAFDLLSGSDVYSREFSASVMATAPCFAEDGRFAIAMALADGTLDIVSPAVDISDNNDMSTCAIPYTINSASICETGAGSILAFVRPNEQPERLLCYMFYPWYSESDIEEFTLDELIGYAHSALDFS